MALTVQTAATFRLLTTVRAVRTELELAVDVARDGLLLRLIRDASAAIETYCGRTLAKQTYLETLAGQGSTLLMLKVTPIISVASVLNLGTAITDWSIQDPKAGFLYREKGWRWTAQYGGFFGDQPLAGSETLDFAVTYEAGYTLPPIAAATLPGDIERAAIQTVKAWYLSRKEPAVAGALVGKSVDDLSLQYAAPTETLGAEHLPPAVRGLLGPHRRAI